MNGKTQNIIIIILSIILTGLIGYVVYDEFFATKEEEPPIKSEPIISNLKCSFNILNDDYSEEQTIEANYNNDSITFISFKYERKVEPGVTLVQIEEYMSEFEDIQSAFEDEYYATSSLTKFIDKISVEITPSLSVEDDEYDTSKVLFLISKDINNLSNLKTYAEILNYSCR